MPSTREPAKTLRPAVAGEVLFDRFDDGRSVLGGAPFNVAWNLRGFGFDPLFLSAVGDDEPGRDIRRRAVAWGMDDAWLQTAVGAPTGEVRVTLDRGEPSYDILRDVAYDRIQVPPDASTREDVGLLYHGSLAFRSETTRHAIREVRSSLGVPVFVDVNVRKGCFEKEWLPDLLGGVAWVKLNRDEIASIAGVDPVDQASVERGVEILRERYDCRNVWLTCGERGAYALTVEADGTKRTFRADAPRRGDLVDAVGAGDAFAAVAIAGALTGEEPERTLERAVSFAANVCGIRGAVTDDPGFYDACRKASSQAESDR